MSEITCIRPAIGEMPAKDYHAADAVSKSALWTFRNRRRMYEAEYVTRTAPPRKPTDGMEIGTLAHAGLLEPEAFGDMYSVCPPELLSKDGKATTTASKQWIADEVAVGKIVVKQDALDTIAAMVAAVRKKLGTWLVLQSQREASVFWTEPETGLRCKCRPDWLIVADDTAYIFDLKTTTDCSPSAFRKTCEDYGYWLQHAHYLEGVEQLQLATNVEFLFVVVETKFPFACNVQQIDHNSHTQAKRARMRLLWELKNCIDSGDFSEPWEERLIPIELRSWAFE